MFDAYRSAPSRTQTWVVDTSRWGVSGFRWRLQWIGLAWDETDALVQATKVLMYSEEKRTDIESYPFPPRPKQFFESLTVIDTLSPRRVNHLRG